MMARTLDEGTENHTSSEFALLLERKGVALGAGASDSGISVDLDVAKRHLEYALDLLRQALTEPAFPAAEVAPHRQAAAGGDRAGAASVAAQRGAHGAARDVLRLRRAREPADRPARRETVSAITRDDVVAFHGSQMSPTGATLVLAGDLDGVDAFAVARGGPRWLDRPRRLGGAAAARRGAHGEQPGTRRPRRPAGSVQTELVVAATGPDRRVDGGWAPFPVLGFVLGGSPNARVDAVLREEKGYTYGIRSVFRPRRRGGLFLTSGSVRGDVTVEALDILLTSSTVRAQGFTDAETKQGVDYIAMTAAEPLRHRRRDRRRGGHPRVRGADDRVHDGDLRDLADVDARAAGPGIRAGSRRGVDRDRRRRRGDPRRRHPRAAPHGRARRHGCHGVSPVAQVVVDTPIGPLLLVASEGALTHVWFDGLQHASSSEAELPPEDAEVLGAATVQLAEYFAGDAPRLRPAVAGVGNRVPEGGLGPAGGDPLGDDDDLRRDRHGAGHAVDGIARGRRRQRREPDLDHRSVSPRDRRRRDADRLRRRPAAQVGAAPARGRPDRARPARPLRLTNLPTDLHR